MAVQINVNGARHRVSASKETPLLYVLHDELHLRGAKFGCGLAQCGACAVLLDGQEIRSCVTPVGTVTGRKVTTLEGLPAQWANERHLSAADAAKTLHPVQQAWIDEQVPQCGYCQNGMVIQAVALLSAQPHPSEAQIRAGMNQHLCRCATYNAIVRAVRRASAAMAV